MIKKIPDKLTTNDVTDGSVTKGKFSKKIVHYNAGAPTKTNDTGEGYAQGTLWIDTTNGDMYVCTAHTAEDSVWQNMEGDDVNNVSYQGTNTSFGIGGRTSPGSPNNVDTVDKFSLSSDANASDCLLYTSPSPRDQRGSRMPSSA